MPTLPLERLKVVLLDCPYDSWDDPFTKEIFHKTLSLKLAGYRREYPYGVLPFDTTDFIGTHHVLCLNEDHGLEPIMAYRTITAERAQLHSLSFPVQTLMKLLSASTHEEEIKKIVTRCKLEKRALSYASSLAVHDSYKGLSEVRDVLKAMHVLYHQEYNIPEIVGGGVLRFKVDAFYKFWGYEPLARDGEALPPLPVPFVFNEVTGFYHLKKFSDLALAHAKKLEPLWRERITINSNAPSKEKKAA